MHIPYRLTHPLFLHLWKDLHAINFSVTVWEAEIHLITCYQQKWHICSLELNQLTTGFRNRLNIIILCLLENGENDARHPISLASLFCYAHKYIWVETWYH